MWVLLLGLLASKRAEHGGADAIGHRHRRQGIEVWPTIGAERDGNDDIGGAARQPFALELCVPDALELRQGVTLGF